MEKGIMAGLLCLTAYIGCQSPKPGNPGKNKGPCEVIFRIENGYNQLFYLEDIRQEDDKKRRLDSVWIKDRVEDIRFKINDPEENLYQVRSSDSRMVALFINDASPVHMQADYLNPGNFVCLGSPATTALHGFLTTLQQKIAPSKQHNGIAFWPGATPGYTFAALQQDYRHFIDTASSPAVVLYIHNLIDFGHDYKSMQAVVTRIASRFPDHTGIQQLYNDTKKVITIFEEEYQVGDQAPDITLPDADGKPVTLSAFKGKFILLDFWASWYNNSLRESPFKLKAWHEFHHKNLVMISISLDPEKAMWKQNIQQRQYPWIQLHDEQAWNGRAAETYKFDSIPFNFLIDPGGRIVAKAAYGDSLLSVLRKFIK